MRPGKPLVGYEPGNGSHPDPVCGSDQQRARSKYNPDESDRPRYGYSGHSEQYPDPRPKPDIRGDRSSVGDADLIAFAHAVLPGVFRQGCHHPGLRQTGGGGDVR